MARRGNGAGQGDGWGGPAKGAGSISTRAEPFGHGNTVSAVQRDMSGAEKAWLLKEHLYMLATTAAREETQISAAVAWLDRHEGKPIARNVNMTPGDVSLLDDGTLAAIALGEGDQTIN